MNRSTLEARIEDICKEYDRVINIVDKTAQESKKRSYGGVVRATKGNLQEHITELIIRAAWESLSHDNSRLTVDSKKTRIPIQEEYIAQIKDKNIKDYIHQNKAEYCCQISVDRQVYVDKKLVIGIECKTYTENAMIKRILVDFSLLKKQYPQMRCYLFQLESQLTGDYSTLNSKIFGSHSTHTLQSYFATVDRNIHTFVAGERKVKEPIHKKYKPICPKKIREAIVCLSSDLSGYL